MAKSGVRRRRRKTNKKKNERTEGKIDREKKERKDRYQLLFILIKS